MKKGIYHGLRAVFLLLVVFLGLAMESFVFAGNEAFSKARPDPPMHWYESPWLWIAGTLAFVWGLSKVLGSRSHRRGE